MTRQVREYIQKFKERLDFEHKVLEVGALDINGRVRDVIESNMLCTEYVALDQEDGPGVDFIGDGEKLIPEFSRNKFDVVLCLETLEHTPHPWIMIDQMKAVLKPGGWLVVSTPTFGFPLHRYPKDYYRYGTDAYYDVILEGCCLKEVIEYTTDAGYPGIIGSGKKI